MSCSRPQNRQFQNEFSESWLSAEFLINTILKSHYQTVLWGLQNWVLSLIANTFSASEFRGNCFLLSLPPSGNWRRKDRTDVCIHLHGREKFGGIDNSVPWDEGTVKSHKPAFREECGDLLGQQKIPLHVSFVSFVFLNPSFFEFYSVISSQNTAVEMWLDH